jgi:hypothetical protein
MPFYINLHDLAEIKLLATHHNLSSTAAALPSLGFYVLLKRTNGTANSCLA